VYDISESVTVEFTQWIGTAVSVQMPSEHWLPTAEYPPMKEVVVVFNVNED
jgi:hypothetical protein